MVVKFKVDLEVQVDREDLLFPVSSSFCSNRGLPLYWFEFQWLL